MKGIGKWVLRVLGVLVLGLAGIYAFAPRIEVPQDFSFDQSALKGDLEAYLAAEEALFAPKEGTEKAIHWAGEKGAKTPLSIIYLHGFTASGRELSPVPETVAKALGANLFVTRYRGHGVAAQELGAAMPADWMYDTAEALAIGAQIGGQTLVIGTSTGGSIATLIAANETLQNPPIGYILVAPNYKAKSILDPLSGWPLARHYIPLLAGETHKGKIENDQHAQFWTIDYPTRSFAALGAVVKAAAQADHSAITAPVLVLYAQEDKVVDAGKTDEVLGRWGGPKRAAHPRLGEGFVASGHVIAGDIRSPAGTDWAIEEMVNWAKEQGFGTTR
ncbi:MAG: alpha/beta hydrolase [Paracoccaceae bacterium]